MSAALKVCYAASEVSPFAKTGGLADVASALPRQLHRLGHDVRVFLPFYSVIDREDHGFQVVDFARDVTLDLGGREFRFTLWSTRLPNSQQEVYLVDCPELFRRPGIYTSEPDEPHRFVFCKRGVHTVQSVQRTDHQVAQGLEHRMERVHCVIGPVSFLAPVQKSQRRQAFEFPLTRAPARPS